MKSVQNFLVTLLFAVASLLAFGQSAPRISLLTAEPGPEIYELYGHEGVRVISPDGNDIVYNFGLFDFNEPNFIYRFVKGETDYMGGVVPTPVFLSSYAERGSKVTEQVLNLTPSEALKMDSLLRNAVLPANASYRYKYCTNNCATRVVDILEQSVASPPLYPSLESAPGSYRDVMRRYDSNYPWYILGVDMALGNGIDSAIDTRQRMFVPLELHDIAASTRLADGRPLVKSENVLVQGQGDRRLGPTPFLLSPIFWAWLLLFASLLIVYNAMRRGWNVWRWWVSAWFFLTGIVGCLSWFLIFISVHEATSPNILGWWLNPLWLIPAFSLWMPGARRFTRVFLCGLSLVSAAMLLAWCFGAQQSSYSLMLFCVTTLVLSLSYALTGASTHRRHRHHHVKK